MAHRSLAIFRRRLFTILSALSLLLCIATVALWVRSYFVCDIVRGTPCVIYSLAGRLVFITGDTSQVAPLGWTRDPASSTLATLLRTVAFPGPRNPWWERSGFMLEAHDQALIGLPHWSLALLFAILPALRFRAAIRDRKRRRVGLCRVCGYDLRATPDRCPECGRVNDQFPNPNHQQMTKPR